MYVYTSAYVFMNYIPLTHVVIRVMFLGLHLDLGPCSRCLTSEQSHRWVVGRVGRVGFNVTSKSIQVGNATSSIFCVLFGRCRNTGSVRVG